MFKNIKDTLYGFLDAMSQDPNDPTNKYRTDTTKEYTGNSVFFKDTDPRSFLTYLGQEEIKRRITLRLGAMNKGDSFKLLFSAPAGIGKTAFARVISQEMLNRNLAENYYEIVAGKFSSKKDLDIFLHKIPSNSIIFIDEIHGLISSVRDALLPAIQDNRYSYGGTTTMLPLPSGISWLGATTDIGSVHPAVQRRMFVVYLQPLKFSDRFVLTQTLDCEITEKAAYEIAKRCWTPWEIKEELFVVAKDLSKEKNMSIITADTVLEACDILGIDEKGLRPHDRSVIECLYFSPKILCGLKRYIMAVNSLTSACGLDSKQYKNAIEPKLIRLGYIQISSAGRELTQKAIDHYFTGNQC